MEKKCFKCGRLLPLEEFYAHKQMADGHLNKCKACTRIDVVVNRVLRVGYYRDYDIKRSRTDARKQSEKQYKKNPRAALLRNDANARYRSKNPDKYNAHKLVTSAVACGRLLPKNACELCGVVCKTEGHHADYSRPLDVIWLCKKCHSSVHVSENNKKKKIVRHASLVWRLMRDKYAQIMSNKEAIVRSSWIFL